MKPININALQEIQALIEVLRELDDIDTIGNGIGIKIKILNRIDSLLDTL
ncbi:hypothetical protein UFOVP384_40 [uncultured Caudovirales phage]|uniref:Uncharacterized protein n=1 Tax=uncultured Caudovirales phage TaxID=2100421 RepID=A0A6J7X522_9CAUD|nr:hypothetical protein UFOVP384_40 [uncultured Caudovirales phage]